MTRDHVVLQVLDAVRAQVLHWMLLDAASKNGTQWVSCGEPEEPQLAKVSIRAVNALGDNQVWLTREGFLEPPALYLARLHRIETPQHRWLKLKAAAPAFDAAGLRVSQRWATSKDGTRVPYFLVSHDDGGAVVPRPAILYGYGGFGHSMLPRYLKVEGVGWLTKGGVYAVANIRGGGEFGPEWHQAAVREGRHRAYEDFAAVAEALVADKVASSAHLAAEGGSNGGLLVGNMLVKYPKLFGAVVCSAPLLDMKRYDRLLAGASWVPEYGDPRNSSDWAFLRNNSPYQLVNPAVDYPSVLFLTSTRDDRVHPAHARKMAAKLEANGSVSANHTFFYESTEGGHASSSLAQYAFTAALKYRFLGKVFGLSLTS
uniref:Prolyl endopeptidase n=1 Tax=Zooxanthella nutricula TaxID=1333877 RepID=A0A7S2M0J4_9DINO